MDGDVLILVDEDVACLAKDCEGYNYLREKCYWEAKDIKDRHKGKRHKR